MSKQTEEKVTLTVNGVAHILEKGRDFDSSDTLASVLKCKLGLTGLKVACDEGACGACTVIMDGVAVLSCMVLAGEADGREILTIEGLGQDDPVVLAFAQQSEPGYGTAIQCGYCTPGFVMAAKVLGVSNTKIILRHLIPNGIGPVLVSFVLGVAAAVLVEAALSFLGLGVQPPTPSWGNILMEGKATLGVAWWLILFPGLAILITVLAFNLLGEGIRDFLNPRLRK